ncbi:type I methionyl aminopeptidase [Tumebacillus permanentifrigoris]|uniref:Methionine aminopeptidase n=1 Tax=Tumebacillus permanentifrigoris TaxID=378543 RepID=A0A316D718_9BACL|nr:type I methionyl aminopeptidase [Tumebacillus permanentifrigoris]PWK05118.1 methionyl aminopeptidase [Tumebacillus permanentifrigoris]
MIEIKTAAEIAVMREAGRIIAEIHAQLATMIRPGITTMEINEFADSYMRSKNAIPAQIGYHGYPFATCASVNDVICHGFPSKYVLKEGDIVTIDMVATLDGMNADSAWSYAVGEISPEAKRLMEVTHESLFKGIEKAVSGNRIGDCSNAIQVYVEQEGFSVVRDFIGHGIGRAMHEGPEVPHFGPAGRGPRIREGMVFTIEPMINSGKYHSKVDQDGWTARTVDGSLSCQYEHTIAITADGPQILTVL